MLRHLHIQNYALISRLDIDFEEGFSVLTGETGAGKSIILGALALVLGARADSKAITDGEDKCIIEATFDVQRDNGQCTKDDVQCTKDDVQCTKDNVQGTKEIIIRRELYALANKLIDIHSQHANLLIENADFQLEVVDTIACNEAQRSAYSAQYERYTAAVEQLHHLQALAKKSRQDADYIQYRYQLLNEANLQTGELEELENEQYQLSHAEEIQAALQTAIEAIQGEQGSAIEALRMCHLDDAATELQERIESTRIELQDIAEEAERKLSHIEMDPQRLQWVEERIASLEELLHKFNAESLDELIAMRDELAEQVNRMDSFEFDIAQAQKAVDTERAALTKASAVLTKRTRRSARESRDADKPNGGLHAERLRRGADALCGEPQPESACRKRSGVRR